MQREVLGEVHPQVAISLGVLSTFLYSQRKYCEVEELRRESLSIKRGLFSEDHPSVTTALNDLAVVLGIQGKHAEAEKIHRRVLVKQKSRLGERHPDVAVSLSNLASVLTDQGDYAEAEKYFRQVLAMQRELLGEHHSDVAASLNNLASVLHDQGNYVEAEELFRSALGMWTELFGKQHIDVAISKSNLAMVLNDQGKHREAEEYCRRTLSMQRGLLGELHPDVATTLDSLVSILLGQGKYAEAEKYCHEALSIKREVLGEKDPSLFTSLNNLAVVLSRQGKCSEANEYCREALSMRKEVLGRNHPDVALALGNLAVGLNRLGRSVEAEVCLRDALGMSERLLGNDHPDVASQLNNLALVLRDQERYVEAGEYLLKSLSIWRKLFGEEHRKRAMALNNLAVLWNDQGRYEEAEKAHRDVLVMTRDLVGEHHPDVATSLNNLAIVLQDQGKYAEAEECFREALKLDEELLGDQHPSLRAGLNNLAWLLHVQGKYTEAEPVYRQALSIAESVRTTLIGGEIEQALFDHKQQLRSIAFSYSEVLVRKREWGEAFSVAETGRGRVLLDLLVRSDRDLVADAKMRNLGTATTLEKCLEEEGNARTQMIGAENALALAGRANSCGPEHRQEVGKRVEGLTKARRRLRNANAKLFQALRAAYPDARPGKLAETRRALKPNEILVSYTSTRNAVTLLLVGLEEGAGLWGTVLLDGEDAGRNFARKVSQFADLLRSPQSRVDPVLRQEIVNCLFPEEVRERISSARKLIIVADGPLQQIPFEVFLGLERGPTLVYASSASVFLNRRKQRTALAQRNPRESSALLVGDPAFKPQSESSAASGEEILSPLAQNASPSRATRNPSTDRTAKTSQLDQIRLHGGEISPLPGTKREIHQIDGLLRKSGIQTRFLLGKDASLPNLEELADGVRFLHLATHGLQGTTERPYDASLALAIPEVPTAENIGFLTLDRLVRRWREKLSKCELVVLSACDTQRGAVVGGSMVSLPWGFFYAGAPAVVASLWKANDEATALLMGRFYENLLGQFQEARRVAGQDFLPGKPIPKAMALREAKLWLRGLSPGEIEGLRRSTGTIVSTREGDTDFSHPSYWAGFVYLGAPE